MANIPLDTADSIPQGLREAAALPPRRKPTLTDDMPPEIHISYQVTIVSNLMSFGNSHKNYARFGLNMREWRTISCIWLLGPMTASQIVTEVVQDKANISRAIAELGAKGLITKLPNFAHKRSPLIWVTVAGKELYDLIVPVFNQQAEMFSASLTDEEKLTLCSLLDKLKLNVESVRLEEGLE
jgi:DNA-binding MarR family transcriptional regulator